MSPRVDVVVPCKDEVATISICLWSLRTEVPAIDTIIVIDNCSTDGSRELAESLADQVVDLPGVAISTLRNTGAALLGDVDVIGFVDADCEVASGWLAAGLRGLDDFDMVGSRTLAQLDAPWVAAARWAAIEKERAHHDSLLWSQHLLVRRATFEQLKGFDEAVPTGEDADLSARVRQAGGSISLREGMVVRHHGFPKTLPRFVRRNRWHTSMPGWFGRMAPKSRALVVLATAWGGVGLVGAGAAVAGSPRPLVGWGVASALALPALGMTAGRSPRHSVQDGVLMGIWSLVRASRLGDEIPRSLRTHN
jgi:glycosyltransferase involved in cell wall biosynthesis